MELILLLVVLGVVGAVALVMTRRSKERELQRRQDELAPVKKLAFEDITAFGVDLQELDYEMSGHDLDAGANADYQRALDTYESAKTAGDSITQPEDIRHITSIVEDGRYAVACVRARVEGRPLPTRRPPCFFDPRHGPSVADVLFVPPDGVERDVPACALDVERVNAGAEPDVRKVMVGAQRVPYYQGGRAYEPYAAGYFGAFGPMSWMFMGGMMFGDLGGGYDGGGDGGDGGGPTVATVVATAAGTTVGVATAADSTAAGSTSAASEPSRHGYGCAGATAELQDPPPSPEPPPPSDQPAPRVPGQPAACPALRRTSGLPGTRIASRNAARTPRTTTPVTTESRRRPGRPPPLSSTATVATPTASTTTPTRESQDARACGARRRVRVRTRPSVHRCRPG